MSKLIVILGPTASGKSEIAIKLAKKFKGEIVSADSRMIYKEMDIATAKPLQNKKLKIKNRKYKLKFRNKKIQKPIIIQNIPHYLIDIVKPNQKFTVAQFKQKAIKIIRNIQRRKKIPFLVGGTGLYIKAVVENLEIPRVPPDEKLRKKLEKEDIKKLWEKLLKLDPKAEEFVQPENKRRIIRALEVCLKTKKPFSQLRKRGKPLFDALEIGLKIPRKKLYQRINKRVEKMIKEGLVEETKNLLRKYSPSLPSMSGIGYKEISLYLKGEISLEKAIHLIKKNTRHYARRQLTWFKKDKKIKWLSNYKEIEKEINEFLISNSI